MDLKHLMGDSPDTAAEAPYDYLVKKKLTVQLTEVSFALNAIKGTRLTSCDPQHLELMLLFLRLDGFDSKEDQLNSSHDATAKQREEQCAHFIYSALLTKHHCRW